MNVTNANNGAFLDPSLKVVFDAFLLFNVVLVVAIAVCCHCESSVCALLDNAQVVLSLS